MCKCAHTHTIRQNAQSPTPPLRTSPSLHSDQCLCHPGPRVRWLQAGPASRARGADISGRRVSDVSPRALPGGGAGWRGRGGDLARPPSSGAGRKVSAQPGVINKTRSPASPDGVINIGGHRLAGRPQPRTQPGVQAISARANIAKACLPVSTTGVSYQLNRIYSQQ